MEPVLQEEDNCDHPPIMIRFTVKLCALNQFHELMGPRRAGRNLSRKLSFTTRKSRFLVIFSSYIRTEYRYNPWKHQTKACTTVKVTVLFRQYAENELYVPYLKAKGVLDVLI